VPLTAFIIFNSHIHHPNQRRIEAGTLAELPRSYRDGKSTISRLAASMLRSRHRTGTRFTLGVTKREHRLFHLNPFASLASLAHNPLILRMRASYQMICRLFGTRPKNGSWPILMITPRAGPAAERGDSSAAVRLAFGGFRTVNLPLDRAVLSPSSPLLASDRGRLTGPHPIIKIGQEPEKRRIRSDFQ
jgi:hypothetical protein